MSEEYIIINEVYTYLIPTLIVGNLTAIVVIGIFTHFIRKMFQS